jgi:uncharacterized protein (DUF58 family)
LDGKLLLQEIRGRPIDLVPGKKVVSINPGEWTSPFEGKGYEPFGYRDFQIGDNPRQVHMPTSARRGIPTIVERVALRDFKLMVVIDLSRSMCVRRKIMILHEAAAVMLYAAWQAETTFGLAVRDEQGVHSMGLGIGSRHFYHAYRILWRLCAPAGRAAPTGSLVHLRRCLPPNAMLIYCSDFLDAGFDAAGLDKLLRAVGRYDFVPLIIQDELEYTFPSPPKASLVAFSDPQSAACEDVWLSQAAARQIAILNETRFASIVGRFRQRDIKHVHLSSPGVDTTYAAINAFFRRRRRQSA